MIHNFDYIYLLGIGGAALTPIAKWYLWQGKKVFGYDRSPSENTKNLESLGVKISYKDEIDSIPEKILISKEKVLIIYTPSLGNNDPSSCKIFFHLSSFNFLFIKRSDFFLSLTKKHFTVACAGTHGKTSTTALLSHIAMKSSLKVVCFIGGKLKSYNDNFLYNCSPKDNYVIIVEADEYDRFFLSLHYDLAMVTTSDADHLDYYKSEKNFKEAFINFICFKKKQKKIFLHQNVYDDFEKELSDKKNIFTYSLSDKSDVYTKNIIKKNEEYQFDYVGLKKEIFTIKTIFPGTHQINNILGVASIALEMGISSNIIYESINSFPGVNRRFNIIYKSYRYIFIDDFAHHPREINSLIDAVKDLYGDKKIFIIFQPHMYSRTKSFLSDFADSLAKSDAILLLDVYAAREKKIEGGTSLDLYHKISIPDKFYKRSVSETLKYLDKKNHLEIILTVGAGDIFSKISEEIISYLKRV